MSVIFLKNISFIFWCKRIKYLRWRKFFIILMTCRVFRFLLFQIMVRKNFFVYVKRMGNMSRLEVVSEVLLWIDIKFSHFTKIFSNLLPFKIFENLNSMQSNGNLKILFSQISRFTMKTLEKFDPQLLFSDIFTL